MWKEFATITHGNILSQDSLTDFCHVRLNKEFTDDYESNSDDNWIYLSKGEEQYTISSNSMSFELLIYREGD